MPAGHDFDVKGLRERLGLSQPDFAALLGIDPITVSRWERGVAKPSRLALGRLEALAKRRQRRGSKTRREGESS